MVEQTRRTVATRKVSGERSNDYELRSIDNGHLQTRQDLLVQVHVAGRTHTRVHKAGQRQSGSTDGGRAPHGSGEGRGGPPREKAITHTEGISKRGCPKVRGDATRGQAPNPAILHSRERNAAQIRTGGAAFGRTERPARTEFCTAAFEPFRIWYQSRITDPAPRPESRVPMGQVGEAG